MRILFTFAGGNGHLDPLIPIARAAEAAGHAGAVTGRPGVVPAIEAAGLTAIPTGIPSDQAPQRQPLLEPDAEREDRVFRYGRTRRCPARRPDGWRTSATHPRRPSEGAMNQRNDQD